MQKTLETERLILRPLTINDLPAIYSWASDPRVAKFMIYTLFDGSKTFKAKCYRLYL